jgi:hypothetical protein
MSKIKRSVVVGVVASEAVHLFCCVLPTIFSVLSLLAGAGMIATMPGFIEDTHHLIHDYEIPMIITSGVILIIGWVLYLYSRRIDCHVEGECHHAPCDTKKDRTKLFMIIATALFLLNVTVYTFVHKPHDEAHHEEHHHEHL